MKKTMLALAALMVLACASFAQSVTPNLNLNIPPFGTPNWQVPNNQNWIAIDQYLSGVLALPAIKVTGPMTAPQLTTWSNTVTYPAGGVVYYLGTAYASLAGSNRGNLPTSTAFWTTTISSGGGGVFPAAQYLLPSYAAGGTDVGGSNIATDSTGNNLVVPGTVTATFTQTVNCVGTRTGTDQASLQAAINYITANAPYGRGTIKIPEGQTCYVYMPSGSGAAQALLMQSPISISGSAKIFFDVPSGMDWVRIAPLAQSSYWPTAIYYAYQMVWRDVTMNGATAVGTGAATGRHSVNFDCTNGGAGGGNGLGKILFDNVFLGYSSTGNSLYANNTGSYADSNGCIYQSNFKNSTFQSGINFTGTGDTISIEDNQINNLNGDGVFISSIAGAVDNKIAHNNIVPNGSTIHLQKTVHAVIDSNEIGVSSYGTVPTTATIWLDGTTAGYPQDTLIVGNYIGVDQSIRPEALPLLQIDSQVTDTRIGINHWFPQIVSGTPTAAVLNNGSYTCIVDGQIYPRSPNYKMMGGNGSKCKDTWTSLTGLGQTVENRLLYSEDLTQSAWTPVYGGAASAPTITTVSTTLPDGTTGNATRIQMTINAGTTGADFARISQAIAGLTNPHSSVSQVFVKSNTCTLYTIDFYSGAAGEATTVDCTGDYNGWRHPYIGIPSVVAATTDSFTLGILGGSVYSSTVDILVWGAQQSANKGNYAKTAALVVTQQFGTTPDRFVGPNPITSKGGLRDLSTSHPCNASLVGTIYATTAAGIAGAPQQTCVQLTTSPATYGLKANTLMSAPFENYILQSNAFTTTPWTLAHVAGGSNPVCTSAPSIPDPFGNTGDVWDCVFAVTSSTSDYSELIQSVSTSSTNSALANVWVQAKTGTPSLFLGFVSNGSHLYTTTSTWQQLGVTATSVSGTYQWIVFLAGGFGTTTGEYYISQPQLSFNGGVYAATTTVPVDTTASGGLINAANMCSGTIPGSGYYCDGNTHIWTVLPASGASTPATSNLLKGTGSANGVTAATPGTDYLNNSAIPATSSVLKGTGTAGGSAGAAIGTDYVAPTPGGTSQLINQTGGSVFAATNNNKHFQVSAFPSSCTTNEGSFTTQLECAWFTVFDYAVANTAQPELDLGYGYYVVNHSLYEPTANFTGISLVGAGMLGGSVILANSVLSDAVIYKAETTSGGTWPQLNFRDFSIDGEDQAQGCMRLWGVQNPVMKNIGCTGVPNGAPFMYQFGEPNNYGQGWMFGAVIDNVGGSNNGTQSLPAVANRAVITPTVSGGGIATNGYVVSNGGTGYPQPSTEVVLQPYLLGNQNGTSDLPCATMPTGLAATVNGSGVITGVTSSTPASGCAGTVYVAILPETNFTVALMDIWASDSRISNSNVYGANIAIETHSGNVNFNGMHPTNAGVGIYAAANGGAAQNNVFRDTELDTLAKWGFDVEGSGGGVVIDGTNAFGNFPQSFSPFHIGSSASVQFGAQSNLTAAATTTDYHEFLMPYGTFEANGYLPNGTSISPNDTLGSSLGSILMQPSTLGPTSIANSSNSYPSNKFNFNWNSWNSGTSKPQTGQITMQAVPNSGVSAELDFTSPVAGSAVGCGNSGNSPAMYCDFYGFGRFYANTFNYGTSYFGSSSQAEIDASGNITAPTMTITGAPGGSYVKADGTGYGTPSGGGGTTTNALTLNNSGSGASSGTTFNGSAAQTLSYNTIGAAPLASPTFTGTPAAPTPSTSDNSTKIPTTAYVQANLASPPAIGGTAAAPSVTTTNVIPAGTPVIDVRSQGAKCDGSTNDTTAIANAATLAGTLGGILYIPNTGTACLTASEVVLPPGAWMEVEGDLKATASMTAVVATGTGTTSGTYAVNKAIYGHGTIDPNGFATIGIFVRSFQHYQIQDVQVGNASVAAIQVGDPALSCRSAGTCYEALITNTVSILPSATAKTTGSIGIDLQSSDNVVRGNHIVGYDIGITDNSSGSIIADNHVWGSASNYESICYNGLAGNSFWTNDVCDGPGTYGFYLGAASDQLLNVRVDSDHSNNYTGVYFNYGNPGASLVGSLFEGASGAVMTAALGGFANSGLYLAGNTCGSNVTSCNVVNPGNYGAGAGTANAQTANNLYGGSSYPGFYVVGTTYCWLPSAANTTTTPTININTIGAVTITKFGQSPLAANDLITTAIACVKYDGTDMELQNPATLTNAAATNVANTFSTAQSVTGLPAGCMQVPCQVASVGPATYSGTSSTGLVTLYSVPSGGAGTYRICSSLMTTVSPSAATSQEMFVAYTGDGHSFSNPGILNDPSLGSALTQWNGNSGCGTFYADASTNIQWEIFLSGVTGTPTYRYSIELERVIK